MARKESELSELINTLCREWEGQSKEPFPRQVIRWAIIESKSFAEWMEMKEAIKSSLEWYPLTSSTIINERRSIELARESVWKFLVENKELRFQVPEIIRSESSRQVYTRIVNIRGVPIVESTNAKIQLKEPTCGFQLKAITNHHIVALKDQLVGEEEDDTSKPKDEL